MVNLNAMTSVARGDDAKSSFQSKVKEWNELHEGMQAEEDWFGRVVRSKSSTELTYKIVNFDAADETTPVIVIQHPNKTGNHMKLAIDTVKARLLKDDPIEDIVQYIHTPTHIAMFRMMFRVVAKVETERDFHQTFIRKRKQVSKEREFVWTGDLYHIAKTDAYYELGPSLGRGRAAAVFHGRFGVNYDTLSQTEIAIKRLKLKANSPARIANELMVQTLLWDAQRGTDSAIETETSPRCLIARPLFGGRDTEYAWIGMQKLNATFEEYILRYVELTPNSFYTCLNCLKTICTALRSLYMKFKFVHGDLHASNVMVTLDGNSQQIIDVFLIDFGRSRVYITDTNNKALDRRYWPVVYMFQQSHLEHYPSSSFDLLMFLTSLVSCTTENSPIYKFCWSTIANFFDAVEAASSGDGPYARVHKKLRDLIRNTPEGKTMSEDDLRKANVANVCSTCKIDLFHCLYHEHVAISYPPTEPGELVKQIESVLSEH